ncbi:hypothetical protein LINPERPRIM_LOCUS31468 [Linum perenne]
MKSAIVAHFVGVPPPFHVVANIVNRLGEYEGPIVVSKYLESCFLFEFSSIRLCDWILSRSWHIHNSPMFLRRWERGIQPLDFSPRSTPEWITLKGVPQDVISVEGIS